MGKDKAFLPFGDSTVVAHLLQLFNSIFEQTLILVHNRAKFLNNGIPRRFLMEDLVKNRGPLGGLSTGLAYALYPQCFVATCDMPLLHASFIRDMIQAWEGETFDALCTKDSEGRWEPFPGIYSRENRSLINVLINLGHLSMSRLFEVISVDCWNLPETYRDVMMNMNTPADYEAVLEKRRIVCEC